MDIASELRAIKAQVKNEIPNLVDDVPQLTIRVELLKDIEGDESLLAQLERSVREYRVRLNAKLNGTGAVPTLVASRPANKKQRGILARQTFARVHSLSQVRGRLYASASGSTCGIAMATEDRRGNKWWLGLTDQTMSSVVLLCQDANKWLEFILPSTDLISIWSQLSRSNGEIKFNVKRENSRYALTVPGYGEFEITRFLGNYEALKN